MPAPSPLAPEPQRPAPLRRRRHPNRFSLEVFYCLTRELDPFGPTDPLPDDLLASINRLLLRGGRALAHAPAWQRARPFPASMAGAVPARTAVIALMKLLIRLDPDRWGEPSSSRTGGATG
jgi:hypothetical protein